MDFSLKTTRKALLGLFADQAQPQLTIPKPNSCPPEEELASLNRALFRQLSDLESLGTGRWNRKRRARILRKIAVAKRQKDGLLDLDPGAVLRIGENDQIINGAVSSFCTELGIG